MHSIWYSKVKEDQTMGKPTGFLEYERKTRSSADPLERIKNFNEFHTDLSKEDLKEQAARCMNCGIPYCQSGVSYSGTYSGCPLHNLIPEYNDEIYSDNWFQALTRLTKTNNFPEFTGRVCPALCENACVCAINGDAVSTHDNEYAIIEEGFAQGWIKPRIPEVRSDKKVAVIGSGPAGLAVADCLNRRGHSVTVFERDNRPGGLLMYGIPNMKLDKEVIKRRIDLMEAEGVVFKTNCNIGATTPSTGVVAAGKTAAIPAADILAEYDAVILCCGSKIPRGIDVPGSDAAGIVNAVDFLTDATKVVTGQTKKLKLDAKDKAVVVVGGGDTGNDCVATAIRECAKSIIQLDRNPKAPLTCPTGSAWPLKANVYKPDYGQEEAIALFGSDPRMFSSTVKEVIKDKNNKIKKIVTIQIKKSTDPETGKRIITELPGTEETIECDMLILAAGFAGCEAYVADAFCAERTHSGTIKTETGSYTVRDNIFTAGDAHRGQSLVVYAIAEGRACAKEVDKYLMEYTLL